MTPVSMFLRDAFFYHDAFFSLFSEMHFPIMTLVSVLFADALFYHDLGFILADVLFRSCVVIDKGCLSGSVWLRQDGATSKGWLRTRALGNS